MFTPISPTVAARIAPTPSSALAFATSGSAAITITANRPRGTTTFVDAPSARSPTNPTATAADVASTFRGFRRTHLTPRTIWASTTRATLAGRVLTC
jgi:hypothetical protein